MLRTIQNKKSLIVVSLILTTIMIFCSNIQFSTGQVDQLLYSARIGETEVTSIAADNDGNVYICGTTSDPDFFVTENAFDDTYCGRIDSFIMKISADFKTIIYSTFLGGSDYDYAQSLVVDKFGCVIVAGSTASSDFPFSSGSFFPVEERSSHTFVCRLCADGSALMHSSSYEEIPYSSATSIAMDSEGFIYVAGNIVLNPDEQEGIFTLKLNPSCEYDVMFATKHECNMNEPHMSVDDEGNMYIASYTLVYDNPVTKDAYQKVKQPPDYAQTGYIVKIDPTGTTLLYASYLGGSHRDLLHDITVDDKQCLYVTGLTFSQDFPTTKNAFNPKPNTGVETFFVKIDTSETGKAEVVFSSFFGGSGYEYSNSIQIGPRGNIYIGGSTKSLDFPITEYAFDSVLSDGSEGSDPYFDVYLSIFDSTGSKLLYSTYLGGTKTDILNFIFVDDSSNVFINGVTHSEDFPIKSNLGTKNGSSYILKLKPYLSKLP